jgi:dynein heavy chain
MEQRVSWVASQLREGLPGCEESEAEGAAREHKAEIDRVFTGKDSRLIFTRDPVSGRIIALEPSRAQIGASRALYLVRCSHTGSVSAGTVEGGPLETLHSLLAELYMPALSEQHDWGKAPSDGVNEFLESLSRFNASFNDALSSLHGGVELRKPDRKVIEGIELKQQSLTRAASHPEVAEHVERVLDDWCYQVSKMLDNTDSSHQTREPDDAGPGSELDFWRSQMARFNDIMEQLKAHESKVVLGIGAASRSRAYKTWKAIDFKVSDAANEAKDNVKFLQQLDKSLEPIYHGTPKQIIDSLPTLLSNIKMMHSIARYYNTPERMTTLFAKVTNQMISTCKAFLLSNGRLWDQDKQQLIENIQQCIKVKEAYEEQFRHLNERINSASNATSSNGHTGTTAPHANGSTDASSGNAANKSARNGPTPVSQQNSSACDGDQQHQQKNVNGDSNGSITSGSRSLLDVNQQYVFAKFNLFIRRLNKLIDVFTTVDQFNQLAQHTHMEGIEKTIERFNAVVHELRSKQYDLLDFTKTQFDRDHMEFNVQIHDLETSLQELINSCFKSITSIEHALDLLKHFQSILKRDTLKQDLDDKYLVIFQKYGNDLDAVQQTYEKYKNNPPLPRNAPPVAGNIMWARQLLSRIEEPMKHFASNQNIMNTKESKRIVKTYNHVAKALVEYETLWHQAWLRSIESSKVGLQATLIVRHPENGRLLVNFDRKIMQLMRETKFLQRMGVEVPDSAKMVLLQEEKLKHYYNKLSFLLCEYERITNAITDPVRPMMKPHLENMEKKIHPGIYMLTWTSMNIDGYLHHVQNGLSRLEELVTKVNDMLENRVDANLKEVSHFLLVDLPKEQSFTYDAFVSTQSRFIRQQTEALSIKNTEIERAVSDIVHLVRSFPTEDTSEEFPESEAEAFKDHYARLMYHALAHVTKCSFAAIKQRLGSRASGGFFFMEHPFFEVTLELSIPHITTNPSLDDIQSAVNSVAKRMLKASEELYMWGGNEGRTYYDYIACDKEIVKSVLLLTGCIEGAKEQVNDYIAKLEKYDFLWKQDLSGRIDKFSTEEIELELQRYMAIEQEVAQISPVHKIGALSLRTTPLKNSLKSQASSWKAQSAKNLHKQGQNELRKMQEYISSKSRDLSIEINDIEDVREVMGILQEIREKEAEIDNDMKPIEETYDLLARYEVRISKEENDSIAEVRNAWSRLMKQTNDVSDHLNSVQPAFKRDLQREVKEFVSDVQSFRKDWELEGPMVAGLDPSDALERLRKFKEKFEPRKKKWDRLTGGEDLFGLLVTQYPELEKTEKELSLMDKLYSLYSSVQTTLEAYKDYHWNEVAANVDSMGDQVQIYQTQVKKLPKQLREWQAFKECQWMVTDFGNIVSLLKGLSQKCIRPRHWQQLMSITETQIDLLSSGDSGFTLRELLQTDLLSYAEEIEELTESAQKEEKVELKLKAIANEWNEMKLTFSEYKNRGLAILDSTATADLVERLEDSQMVLGSMATNRYSAPFKKDVHTWQAKLSAVSETLELWMIIQNMWTYMEAVLSGGDIVRQLPHEAKRFQSIDKKYMRLVNNALETQYVLPTCYGNDVMRTLMPHLLEQLELCQKSLTAFLDTKRAEFPRFYFVSDPTLLEVLSLGSDPQVVQQHLQSGLFDSLSSVRFDRADRAKIVEMRSPDGEKVKLTRLDSDGNLEDNPVQTKGQIESWLHSLVVAMQNTIRAQAKQATNDIEEMPLEQFIFSYPAQLSLFGVQYMWTADVEAALANTRNDKSALSKTLKKVENTLREMIRLTISREMTTMERRNLETCITVQMHQRDTVEHLNKKRVRESTDFEWLKQCRVYWSAYDQSMQISMCDVDFEYSYEYLGVKERLVITPLTDLCYITLTQALGMYLGGAPAGPAGTGKTETVKDLGNTLGKYVVVFNCSDQLDYKAMGKIYKGLAQSGLWGCFDEFNRINLDVLSVCAQQVFCVLQAIRERKKTFLFTDGSNVPLDPRVGLFITMNPGYAGRNELPENLKMLFRGVAMMHPNRQTIIAVKLAASGFNENQVLSKKFNMLYSLCEQQLSKQPHYDFGLRNILSVLRTMGASKRASPDKSESYLVMRTLRDMNMPKFVAEDVPLFLSLLDDLFPGHKAEKASYAELESKLSEQMEKRNLQNVSTWFNKCMQLYETSLVRHGIIVVGATGVGKTMMTECLAGALSELDVKHAVSRMNPKAITAPQMFGRLDSQTGDWTDGVFSVLWRKAAKKKSEATWIVLDGPVDAGWIENLNTVLDDNKLLTLANGDRVQMTSLMKVMFECENLNNASPATVSRAGIIYVSENELGWKQLMESWFATRPKVEDTILRPCFETMIGPLLEAVRTKFEPVCQGRPWKHYTRAICQVKTLLQLLEAHIDATIAARQPSSGSNHYYYHHHHQHQQQVASEQQQQAGLSHKHYERIFIFCAAWALGGLLTGEERSAFHEEMAALSQIVPTAAEDTVFEHFVSETNGEWEHWSSALPEWSVPKGEQMPKFSQVVIPTIDSVRLDRLIRMVHGVGGCTLLVGGSGTAKTTAVKGFLDKFEPEETASKLMTFSAYTTPNKVQATIEESVEKRQGHRYGPSGGRKMVIFIDDISMPKLNQWGDQETSELIRQLLEQDGFYSLEKPIGDMRHIVDCSYIAAMRTPGPDRNDLPNRLKRQFNIFNVPLPNNASIKGIYGTLIENHFTSSAFGDEVSKVAKKLVPATIGLRSAVQKRMLPTPSKFHYTFSLRELSKVFYGVLSAETDRFNKDASADDFEAESSGTFGGNVVSPEAYLLALWRHECERAFCDQLTTDDDKTWVSGRIMGTIKEYFGLDLARQVNERLHFVSFLREPILDKETDEVIDSRPHHYEAARNVQLLSQLAEDRQREFNANSKALTLDLVLFHDALMHLIRIARLLSIDGGCGLLVGVGGSGKQSLSRLAAYCVGAMPFQITLTKQYNLNSLYEDLRLLYRQAGLKGQKVCFIFTDNEVKDDSFLECVNEMLMTTEVTGLFPKDEIDQVVNDIRPVMKKEAPSRSDTFDSLYNFFISRVRDNLHVMLCFSPIGGQFTRWAQDFQGLINGTTVDWFLSWPFEALSSVSKKYIADFEMVCDNNAKEQLQDHIATVQQFVGHASEEYRSMYRRNVHITPKSYLSFIGTFKRMYSNKWEEVKGLADKVKGGLNKLLGAKEDVNTMKQDLTSKNAELAKSQQKTSELLKELTEKTYEAEKEKSKVQTIVDQVTTKANEVNAAKEEAEADLAQAKPEKEKAEASLNSIYAKDIQTMKTLKSPPDVVKRIFDCVLILRQWPINKVEWHEFKGNNVISGSYDTAMRMLADANQALKALQNFPTEVMNEEMCELLQPYFNAPDFSYEEAKKASGNVAGLCNWAQSMVAYHHIVNKMRPKEQRLARLQQELQQANKEKEEAETNMAEVQAKLDSMQVEFDEAMRNKNALEEDANATQRRMDSANALINALADEESRWTEESKEFEDQIRRLPGDCALAASFISYLGPFNMDFREKLLTNTFMADCQQRGIPFSSDLCITTFLSDESETGEWNINGLPTDELSIQNGIIVTRSGRYPLCVDPQGQGASWIKNKEQENNLRVTTQDDKNFRQTLEHCLTFGEPLLIEDLGEQVDPLLDPIFERRFISKGKSYVVVLADKEVEISDGFKLFLATRRPNPSFSPELSAKVAIIDFTVTQQGLEDQLLGRLIHKEKSELEEQRQSLIAEVTANKKKIKQLEDDLLQRLSNSAGNLLDDTELIDVLSDTKQVSQEVNQKLANASESNKKITEACEDYRPAAHRAALLYFTVADFSTVNVMYQTSLKQFIELYEKSIDNSESAATPSKRISAIIEHLTFSTYKYIQRGLFEQDKLTFALMLANRIELSAGHITQRHLDVFLKGGQGDLSASQQGRQQQQLGQGQQQQHGGNRRKPKDWVPEKAWSNVQALSTLSNLSGLVDSLNRNPDLWRRWYESETPEAFNVPEYEGRVSAFERMCIVRAFREDRTLIAARRYIALTLGQHFLEPTPLDLSAAWHESNPRSPLVCVLSRGTDPTRLIEDTAKRKKMKVVSVSMGQGQETVARKHLNTAALEGHWVMLQNAHLGLWFMEEVETFISKTEDLHPDFRVWITAEPHSQFPLGLLQMSIKMTNEPPVGMRAGLQASYNWINQDTLDAVPRQEWRQLLFITCFLHSLLQERRKFGAIGWNIPYDFNHADLSACIAILKNHISDMDARKLSEPSWQTVRFMIGTIQYGGKITDEFDKQLMDSYTEKLFRKEMLERNAELSAGYKIPDSSDIDEFRKEVSKLADQDQPELFGLHANADFSFRALQVNRTLNTIMDTMPRTSGEEEGKQSAVLSAETEVGKQCEDLLSRMPQEISADHVHERLKKHSGGSAQPLTVFLRQEIDRLNYVISIASSTLNSLRQALAGFLSLTSDLTSAMDAIRSGRAPPAWLAKSWEANSLGTWFSNLQQRHEQLYSWLHNGRPKSYWLGGFFNPQGFLTAVRQEVTRKHSADKWSLDDVMMTSDVTHPPRDPDLLKDAPSEGVYVHGLYLEGASWSGKENSLKDPDPKRLFTPLPVVHISGCLSKDRKRDSCFAAPVYRTKDRTSARFVTTLDLKTDEEPSKWTLRGAAVVMSTE